MKLWKFSFPNDVIVSLERAGESTGKLLELIMSRKVARASLCFIYTLLDQFKKLIVLLYTNDKQENTTF